MANKNAAKIYKVEFRWGDDYRNKRPGLVSADINVLVAADKFDALLQAWNQIKDVVDNEEPRVMNCTTQEVC